MTKDTGKIITDNLSTKSKLKKIPTGYATIQIKTEVKDQVVDFCNRKGYKISRFIENLFLQVVSGSGGLHSGSLSQR